MSNNNELSSLQASYLTQLNKESFKSKYKFIDFKKESLLDDDKASTTNENLKEFYQDLISERTNTTDNKNEIETNTNQVITINDKNETKNRESKSYKPNEYLKAAQNNDLNLIVSFLEHDPSRINLKDDYKWNALMIAVASHNNDIVEYFMHNQAQNEYFGDFLNAQDSAGNTPRSLAIKFNNKKALKLLEESHHQLRNQPEQESKQELKSFYCKLCDMNTLESEENHLKSMSHLINENERETDKNKLTYNYHLRSNNKGYQLLCRSGWNEQSGLGRQEQGSRFPIKTKLKLDREGIGLDKNESKKEANTSTKGRIETSFKSFQEMRKKEKRLRRLERNLRFEFNN